VVETVSGYPFPDNALRSREGKIRRVDFHKGKGEVEEKRSAYLRKHSEGKVGYKVNTIIEDKRGGRRKSGS